MPAGRPRGRRVPISKAEFESKPLEFWGPFEWTSVKDQAAQDIAEGRLTKKQICDKAGVAYLTMYRWAWHPDFAAKVQEYQQLFFSRAAEHGMSVRNARIDALRERLARMQQVIENRQAEYSDKVKYPDAPGEAATGMVVRTEKTAGRTTIVEWTFDKSLAQELRETEKQLAQELGQWTEKRELSADGRPLQLAIVDSIIADPVD